MQYNLVGKSKGVGALTIVEAKTNEEAYYAYLAMFSYDKNGNAKKSWDNNQLYSINHVLTDSKAKSFKSVHSIKNESLKPIGKTRSLTK